MIQSLHRQFWILGSLLETVPEERKRLKRWLHLAVAIFSSKFTLSSGYGFFQNAPTRSRYKWESRSLSSSTNFKGQDMKLSLDRLIKHLPRRVLPCIVSFLYFWLERRCCLPTGTWYGRPRSMLLTRLTISSLVIATSSIAWLYILLCHLLQAGPAKRQNAWILLALSPVKASWFEIFFLVIR